MSWYRAQSRIVRSIYDVASDTIEIDVVTDGNVLLRYHGHETTSRHVGDCHKFIVPEQVW
jgi:hypothetical protein